MVPRSRSEGPDERDRSLLEGLERQGQAYGIDGRAQRAAGPLAGARAARVDIGGHAFPGVPTAQATRPAMWSSSAPPTASPWWVTSCSRVRSAAATSRTATVQRFVHSIRTKLFPLDDDVAFLCGHGPGSTLGTERRTNPYAGERVG